MGFEESMIEDGFHDEEEYLEHLLDEADDFFCRQQEKKYSYYDEYKEDDEYYYDDLDYEYKEWVKKHPLKRRVFNYWLDFICEWDWNKTKDLLDNFAEWHSQEWWHISQLKRHLGDFYPRMIRYLAWEITNPIEEILRIPNIQQYRPTKEFPYLKIIPEKELIFKRVDDFEEWIEQKTKYKQWLATVTDDKKETFLNRVIQETLNNDISSSHVREYILNQFEKEPGIIKEQITNWFDEDCERGITLFLEIQCVKFIANS